MASLEEYYLFKKIEYKLIMNFTIIKGMFPYLLDCVDVCSVDADIYLRMLFSSLKFEFH